MWRGRGNRSNASNRGTGGYGPRPGPSTALTAPVAPRGPAGARQLPRPVVRQAMVDPRNNGLSGNSREFWGLMGDARPPTPSEGRAQYYHRAGPAGQQQTRTYDNGTALTFGPYDPITESEPGSAFDNQFRQIDAAVRNLQVSNVQHPSTARSNSAYDGFRTESVDFRSYPVVPSRFASVEVIPHVWSSVHHLAARPGTAHPGNSTDTRFGENRGIPMSQNRLVTSGNYPEERAPHTQGTRSSNVTSESEDIAGGPIYTSRGTFHSVLPVTGYPPPLALPSYTNVARMSLDIRGRPYEMQGYRSASMRDLPANVPTGPRNLARGSENVGYYQGYGPAPPSQRIPSYVTNHLEHIEPRGRTIERDHGFTKSHRKTAQKGHAMWAQELDERNAADRARGEAVLGGDIDAGEHLRFMQWHVPVPEQREPEEEEEEGGFETPRALSPLRVRVTEASPLPLSENFSGHMEGGRRSAPPGPPPSERGALRGYFATPLYQALSAQDTLRQPPTVEPANAARSTSLESVGENRVFGQLAGSVRVPSQERKGRQLWER